MKAETLPAVTEMFFPSVDEENAPLTLAMWYIKGYDIPVNSSLVLWMYPSFFHHEVFLA